MASQVEIQRTADGTPQIEARSWAGLGWGDGYVQASDDLCTLAGAFVTYRGERSQYFGPDGLQPVGSTLGPAKNLDSDFFFKLIDDDDVVSRYRSSQPISLRQLVDGFVAGYNKYVHEIRSGAHPGQHQECRGQAWVTDIFDADIYRRFFAANIAGGYAHFISAIATAEPPSASDKRGGGQTVGLSDSSHAAQLFADSNVGAVRDALDIGGRPGIGSNAIAFGGDSTTTGQGILLGNPHWFWEGPDRFYQVRLTMPGKLDVAGASFLGVPVVMIGFNRNVAWTHTVSTAKRFGIFELALAPGRPTSYMYDGQPIAMTAVPLSVRVLQPDGTTVARTRTLYRTRFGPVVNLGSYSPALKWQGTHAFAIRDINTENFRVFENFLAWGQAGSLSQFEEIQKRLVATPWVNTIAIGRNDRHVWYADMGPVPNVSDALAATCSTTLGKAFNAAIPGVPFLDGSRSACDWTTEVASPQRGAMPASRLPGLSRTDYVANMNNSYWLANPGAPLTGFPAVMGGEGKPLGLRSRLGLLMVRQRLSGTDGYPGKQASPEVVQAMALNSRVLSAELFKKTVLDRACAIREVVVSRDPLTGDSFPPQRIEIGDACRILRAWDNTGNPQARGAHIWDELWARISRRPVDQLYSVPFDPSHPVSTPTGLLVDGKSLADAIALAVLGIGQGGLALDATRGTALYAERAGERIPLYGGCESSGYFTAACSSHHVQDGGYRIDGHAIGNTYMQVVTFNANGAVAGTQLASSLSDDPPNLHYKDATVRYSQKIWEQLRIITP